MSKYKSITNSMRHVCLVDKKHLNKTRTTISLTTHNVKKNSGRNNSGKITVRSRCNVNRKFIYIDYKRCIHNIPGVIFSKEYDPNRSSFISLVLYKNYICSYILSIHGTSIGDVIHTHNYNIQKYYFKGDSNFLFFLATGSIIHNMEYTPGTGAKILRSAGAYGKLLKKYQHSNKVLIELPSKRRLYTSTFSKATLGTVSNKFHNKVSLGKAGRKRWLGYRPSVRGVAMNPVDHPHGGGEGKRSKHSQKKTPWGKIHKWVNNKKIFKK